MQEKSTAPEETRTKFDTVYITNDEIHTASTSAHNFFSGCRERRKCSLCDTIAGNGEEKFKMSHGFGKTFNRMDNDSTELCSRIRDPVSS